MQFGHSSGINPSGIRVDHRCDDDDVRDDDGGGRQKDRPGRVGDSESEHRQAIGKKKSGVGRAMTSHDGSFLVGP
jgi:hypothetical protein